MTDEKTLAPDIPADETGQQQAGSAPDPDNRGPNIDVEAWEKLNKEERREAWEAMPEEDREKIKETVQRAIEPIREEVARSISIFTAATQFIQDFFNSEEWKSFRAAWAKLAEDAPELITLANELNDLAPYLEEELKKPQYEGKTIWELLELLYDSEDESEEIESNSLFMQALTAARAAEAAESAEDAEALPLEPIAPKNFYNMPNSPASDLVLEILAAAANIADLPARKRQISHATALEVAESGNKRRVTLNNKKSQISVELADIDKISSKPAKKLFVLALIKANEQAIFNGHLTRDYVSFPLQELIDIGFYTTPQSARKGFKTAMDTLTSFKIKGHIQQSTKKESSIDKLRVLFTGGDIENKQCTIYFNPHVNWNFIAQYFTILPRYYFKLSNRAGDLLYYIFYLARQKARDIETKGYFTISFKAIQHRLQLPSEINNSSPYKTIKQPIESAIEEIETEHSGFYGNTEFTLYPVCNDDAPIAEYLNNGYLKIGFSGEFAKTFIERSKETKKRQEKAQKRQERITEKAIAINKAKKINAEEKAQK